MKIMFCIEEMAFLCFNTPCVLRKIIGVVKKTALVWSHFKKRKRRKKLGMTKKNPNNTSLVFSFPISPSVCQQTPVTIHQPVEECIFLPSNPGCQLA